MLPRPEVDPDGLLEYSVVYTDRALNHMSARFVRVMADIDTVLTQAHGAHTVAVVPGGGTYAMESVARQFATGARCLVVRNGFFSYRWSQILEQGRIAESVAVCAASPTSDAARPGWAPAPAEEVAARIRATRPDVVFAAHVETAAGILLPDDYLRTVGQAVREVDGLFVVDGIASGALLVDIASVHADVLVGAPQKGWTGTPAAGFVLLGDRARARLDGTTSSSFALDLARWVGIAEGYREGRPGYHATMPTDALAINAARLLETRDLGFELLAERQWELGRRVRALLAERGWPSVAAPGFESPSVAVVHTTDPELKSAAALKRVGVQAAAGVPLMCGEPDDFSTFRVGLFGLDKLTDVDGAVARLRDALDRL
ncbi:alanine--glyoxylate aminotransferase family protein [Propioniciclava sinopodophylli]|uniref:Alanine--glyoxylate aminotransferase family protein n=2 Tax=Propioniciclava sinopodophylli TaxID=1837344 RepID=A0A4Q9KH51_9ACTN|nr:alanine--glyoxylate aminotransferase family protein [Propioniciclava sinopodophylli]